MGSPALSVPLSPLLTWLPAQLHNPWGWCWQGGGKQHLQRREGGTIPALSLTVKMTCSQVACASLAGGWTTSLSGMEGSCPCRALTVLQNLLPQAAFKLPQFMLSPEWLTSWSSQQHHHSTAHIGMGQGTASWWERDSSSSSCGSGLRSALPGHCVPDFVSPAG